MKCRSTTDAVVITAVTVFLTTIILYSLVLVLVGLLWHSQRRRRRRNTSYTSGGRAPIRQSTSRRTDSLPVLLPDEEEHDGGYVALRKIEPTNINFSEQGRPLPRLPREVSARPNTNLKMQGRPLPAHPKGGIYREYVEPYEIPLLSKEEESEEKDAYANQECDSGPYEMLVFSKEEESEEENTGADPPVLSRKKQDPTPYEGPLLSKAKECPEENSYANHEPLYCDLGIEEDDLYVAHKTILERKKKKKKKKTK